MWPFSRKATLLSSGFLQGWTDWHSHILPGVDDGISSTDAALEVLRWYESQGVREVWLTPHVMEDYPNTPDDLKERFSALARQWEGSVTLHLAAEHMLDALFEERLKRGEVLPIGPEKDSLLVETSCYNAPMNFYELLEQIKKAGFHPLLAHPERYFYLDDAAYRRLHDAGVAFQLNIPSLAGLYGPIPARKARKLLDAGYYTRTGSDLHSLAAFQQALSVPVRPIQF